jgi:hypothetical protein
MSTARLLAEFGGETAIVRRLAYRILRNERDDRARAELARADRDPEDMDQEDWDRMAANLRARAGSG